MRHIISTDASVHQGIRPSTLGVSGDQIAAIAAVDQGTHDPRPLFSDVIITTNVVLAEWEAMMKALKLAHHANFKDVLFRTDLTSIWRMCTTEKGGLHPRSNEHTREVVAGNVVEAKKILKAHKDWTMIACSRTHNAAAHTLCSMTIRAYKAGLEKRPTRTPYRLNQGR